MLPGCQKPAWAMIQKARHGWARAASRHQQRLQLRGVGATLTVQLQVAPRRVWSSCGRVALPHRVPGLPFERRYLKSPWWRECFAEGLLVKTNAGRWRWEDCAYSHSKLF